MKKSLTKFKQETLYRQESNMRLEEIKIMSTKGDIEEFKKSLLWKDIRRELKSWKRGFEVELSGIADDAAKTNPTSASILLHLGDINGRTKAIDYLLSIPDTFISILDSEESKSTPITNEPEEVI